MNTKKKIVWQSWNAIANEEKEKKSIIISDQFKSSNTSEYEEEQQESFILPVRDAVCYTPIGVYPDESPLKPSDRWDCWIGHTNFPIVGKILNILNEEVDGIEALKIMGKYSFFIGVAKLFNMEDIRKQIEDRICSYTEKEILSNDEIGKTVDLMKIQLNEHNMKKLHAKVLLNLPEEMNNDSSNELDSNKYSLTVDSTQFCVDNLLNDENNNIPCILEIKYIL